MFTYLSSCAAELFTDVQPLVQSALDGYNVSIFAYGQTHSGKTHTMVGASSSHRHILTLLVLSNNNLIKFSKPGEILERSIKVEFFYFLFLYSFCLKHIYRLLCMCTYNIW